MHELPLFPVATKRQALGQVVFCLGCCCGRSDRGLPAVPVEMLKNAWRRQHLNHVIQLTISGCLGPCDVPNVALILTADSMEWYGRLEGTAVYQAFIDWASACQEADALLPRPASLQPYRLERFTQQTAPAVGSHG